MREPPAVIEVDLYEHVIMGAVRIVRQTFRVALPGVVQSFARDTTRVAVALGTRFLATDRSTRDEPPVADLPVVMPRGGGYGVAFDLRPDDLAFVVACDGPVRGLYEDGGVVDPQFPQGHDYGCAVVLPGGRASKSEAPTPPANPAGAMTVGAEDGSATLTLRGFQLPSPAEVGSATLATAGPIASLLLGGDAATLGAARLTDKVARDALMVTWMSQVTAFINGLVPGTVTPYVVADFGTISSASEKVVVE